MSNVVCMSHKGRLYSTLLLLCSSACRDHPLILEPFAIAPATVELYVSESVQLTTTEPPSSSAITWQVRDPTIATISPDGFLVAVAPGQTVITATRVKDHEPRSASLTVYQPRLAAVVPPQNFVAEAKGARYGKGYNAITGDFANQCVVYDDQPSELEDKSLDAIASTYSFDLIESRSTFRSALAVTAAASFRKGIFGADASANSYRETSVREFKQLLIFRVAVRNLESILKNPRFTAEALDALKGPGPSQFLDRCGTHFILGFVKGGDFAVVYEVSIREDQRFSDFKATLKAGLKGFGKASGSISKAEAAMTSVGDFHKELVRRGAPDLVPINGTPEELEDYATAFFSQRNAYQIEALTQSYRGFDVRGCGDRWRTCEVNLNAAVQGLTQLSDLSDLQDKLMALGDSLTDVVESDREFLTPTLTEAQQARTVVNSQLDLVRTSARDCRQDGNCVVPRISPPVVTFSRVQWRVISPRVETAQLIGNLGPSELGRVIWRGGWREFTGVCYGDGDNVILRIFSPATGLTTTMAGNSGQLIHGPVSASAIVPTAPGPDFLDDRFYCTEGNPLRALIVKQ